MVLAEWEPALRFDMRGRDLSELFGDVCHGHLCNFGLCVEDDRRGVYVGKDMCWCVMSVGWDFVNYGELMVGSVEVFGE